jgi:polyisoprenoid-binding protein YceI
VRPHAQAHADDVTAAVIRQQSFGYKGDKEGLMMNSANAHVLEDPELRLWPAGTWSIDPAHSVVGFAARHLMSKVRGTFTSVSGQIVTDCDPALCSSTATIETASISTGLEMRDNHLRSADFFDVERFPSITFASTSLRQTDGRWRLVGDLTIKDVTLPVGLTVGFLGVDATGLQGETRIGLSARGEVMRREFGITFGLVGDSKIVVADRVDLTLDIQACLET